MRRRPLRGDEVRNLLCRLHDYQSLILRFMHQFEVPFDNNLVEQDLQMIKIQQKIAGCFRTEEGSRTFVVCAVICPPCTNRAFIS